MISLSTIKAWLCKCMSLQDCLNKVCAPSEKSFRSLLKATCAKKISHIGVRRVQWFFNKIYSTSIVRKIRSKEKKSKIRQLDTAKWWIMMSRTIMFNLEIAPLPYNSAYTTLLSFCCYYSKTYCILLFS